MSQEKTPPAVHPVYDTPRTPSPQRPSRPKGVGYLGTQRVSFEIDEMGRRVILEPAELAGQVAR